MSLLMMLRPIYFPSGVGAQVAAAIGKAAKKRYRKFRLMCAPNFDGMDTGINKMLLQEQECEAEKAQAKAHEVKRQDEENAAIMLLLED